MKSNQSNSFKGIPALLFIAGAILISASILMKVMTPSRPSKTAAVEMPEENTVSSATTSSGTEEESAGESAITPTTPSPASPDSAFGDMQSYKPEDLDLTLDDTNKELIVECTRNAELLRGVGNKNEFNSLDEYLQKAQVLTSSEKLLREPEYQNIHVQDSSGKVLRLNLSPSEDAETFDLEPRFFATDSENLPVPIDTPAEYKGLSNKDLIERFQRSGNVLYNEVSEVQNWGGDTSASITTTNGKIERMQLFFPSGSLGCGPSPDPKTGKQKLRCTCMGGID